MTDAHENPELNPDAHLAAPAPPTPSLLPEDGIADVISKFLEEIDSLAATLPLAMHSIADARKSCSSRLNSFIEEQGFVRDEARQTVAVPNKNWLRMQTLVRIQARINTAEVLVPRSFFVNLVSQYDAFLGRLIRALLLTKPDVLNASEKTLSFSELLRFGSLDAARDHIVEKEVESVLRKNHTEHFDWLENKFEIKLRKDLPVWACFVELTERRNLYVHTGGKVSSQYLQICRAHNVDCSGVQAGQILLVSPTYFRQAYEAIFEIATKLAQVFWRKLKPAELGAADLHLTTVSYHLLVERRYDLAKALLDFATETLKKHFSTESRLRLVINRVQAYKWSGDEARARAILHKEDFSAASDIFKLANATLCDNFPAALALVKRIGTTAGISVGDYEAWPLFRELRKQAAFEPLILELFGEALEVTVPEPRSGSSAESGWGVLPA